MNVNSPDRSSSSFCGAVCYLEGLKDPLEEDEVGVINLWFLRDVLDFHLRGFLLLLFLFLLLLATALFLLLLRLLLLLQSALLLAPLLAVSAPAVFLMRGLGWRSQRCSRVRTQLGGVGKLTSFLDKSELSRSDVAGPEFKSPSSSSSSSKFTQSDQKLASTLPRLLNIS